MNTRRLLLIACCAFASAYALHLASRHIHHSGTTPALAIASGAKVPAISRSLRPNYPYSVIAGGAYSPVELRTASEKDHLVADHYGDFDMKSARLVMLTEDRNQYVSYRMHDRIFWTRNQLRIPKGEILLTDGRNYARTRCGNRLSSTPKANTSPQQPSARVLSLPPFRPELLTKGEITLPPAPPIGEVTQALPMLPFEMPRLAPFIPTAGGGAVPGAAGWPPLESYPPIAPILGGYPIAGYPIAGYPGGYPTPAPTKPGIPVSPVIPTSPPVLSTPVSYPPSGAPPTGPPVISEAPEPASLYLFGVALLIAVSILTRMVRRQSSTAGEN